MLYIKEIMEEKGLSIIDLAEKLGISRQAVKKQIEGKLLVETAARIAKALDVPLWRLFAPDSVKDTVEENDFCAFIRYEGKDFIPETLEELKILVNKLLPDESKN